MDKGYAWKIRCFPPTGLNIQTKKEDDIMTKRENKLCDIIILLIVVIFILLSIVLKLIVK